MKKSSIHVSTHVQLKDSLSTSQVDERTQDIQEQLETNFKKASKKSSEKSKMRPDDEKLIRVGYGVQKDHVDFSLDLYDDTSMIQDFDGIMNKCLDLFDSKDGIESMRINTTKTYLIDKNPIPNFLDEDSLVQSVSKSEKKFSANAIVLEVELEKSNTGHVKLAVIISNDENSSEIDFTHHRHVQNKLVSNIIRTANKDINSFTTDIFNGLGVKRK